MIVLLSSKRRLVQGFLAAMLAGSSFLMPVARLAQPVAAQGATASDGVLAVVGATTAPFYAAPAGEVLSTLPTGAVVTAIGRTADSEWVQIISEQGDTGWVEAAAIVAFGLNRLPVTDGATTAPAGADTAAPTPAGIATATAPAATATATVVPPTATPTATPTQTPAPTATPVPPTATPAPTPTAARPATASNSAATAKSILAIVGGAGTDLLAAPDGEKVKSLGIADALTVTGRNEATDWLYATTADGDIGWVPAKSVVAFGVESLPVVGGVAADAAASATETAAPSDAATAPAPSEEATAATPEEPAAASGATAANAIMATVTLTDARLNIRSGPDASFRVVGKAKPGEELAATGRTSAGDWVRVERSDLPGGTGWVATEFLSFDAPVDSLPVVADAVQEHQTPRPLRLPSAPPRRRLPATAARCSACPRRRRSRPTHPRPHCLPRWRPKRSPWPIRLAIKARPVPDLSGRIAFQDGRNNIYIYDLESGAVRWLTNGFEPDISRDGSKVTFVRGGGVENGIWTVNIDGSDPRLVYGGGEIMRSPKWSPDGTVDCLQPQFGVVQVLGPATLPGLRLVP